MIVQLTGKILESSIGRLVIDVNGVGYELITPAKQFAGLRIGDVVTAKTALVIREDAHTLFGFEDAASKQLFASLHSVSGVGPKSAIAVLSHWDAEVIAEAIADGNDKVFSAVSGIGPKTAKLICVTLAGKISATSAGASPIANDVIKALVGLGWNEAAAAKTVKASLEELPGMSAAELLKASLASVSTAKVSK